MVCGDSERSSEGKEFHSLTTQLVVGCSGPSQTSIMINKAESSNWVRRMISFLGRKPNC